jgi:small subunit ribosomal protein S18
MAMQRSRSPRGGKRNFFYKKKKYCKFCAGNIDVIDYKDTNLLRNYVLEGSMIAPSRATGTCAKHQRKLQTAIKRARVMALLPYVSE